MGVSDRHSGLKSTTITTLLTLPVIDNEPFLLSDLVKFDVQPLGNVVIVVLFQ
jgi:hypothetical protein